MKSDATVPDGDGQGEVRRSIPLWIWAAMGFGLMRCVAGVMGRALPSPDLWPVVWNPATLVERELRLLPGIGAHRARAIVKLRRERELLDAELGWEEVSGIGPWTARRVEAWLAERGVAQPEWILAPVSGARGAERFSVFDLRFPTIMERFPAPWPLSVLLR